MRILLLAPLFLAACVASTPQPAPEPSPAERLVAECALLTRAVDMMAAAGTPAAPGLREGCPDERGIDSRPLIRQTASLREAQSAALPPGLQPGTRAETVFRRMITRGVPVSLAIHLTSDPIFAEAAR